MDSRRRIPIFLLASGLLAGSASAQPSDQATLGRQAQAAMQDREFELAERIYARMLSSGPRRPGLVLNLALAQFSAGKYSEALPRFQEFLESRPDHGPAWMLLGVAHQKLEHPAEAVVPLQRAVALAPDNRRARLELGDALLRSGRPDEALGHFVQLTRVDRSNPRAWLGLGLTYTELSRREAQSLEREFPRSAFRLLLRGHAALARQRYRAAYSHFRAALDADPAIAEAHAAIAEIYEQTGYSDWAQAELLKRPPGASCGERHLECLFQARDLETLLQAAAGLRTPAAMYWRARGLGLMAQQAHERLLRLPPSSAAYRLLASVEELSGRFREAAAAWGQAIELEPGDPSLRRNRLRALRAARQPQETIQEAEALLQLRPESSVARFHLGDALLELGRIAEAIPNLEAAVEGSWGGQDAHASLATAYLRVGRGAEAIPYLEEALRNGEDERLLFQLSSAYRAAGRPQEASEALARREKVLVARGALPGANEITPP